MKLLYRQRVAIPAQRQPSTPRVERRSTTPVRMRCCGVIGYHANGCGLLDQLDAGEQRR